MTWTTWMTCERKACERKAWMTCERRKHTLEYNRLCVRARAIFASLVSTIWGIMIPRHKRIGAEHKSSLLKSLISLHMLFNIIRVMRKTHAQVASGWRELALTPPLEKFGPVQMLMTSPRTPTPYAPSLRG